MKWWRHLASFLLEQIIMKIGLFSWVINGGEMLESKLQVVSLMLHRNAKCVTSQFKWYEPSYLINQKLIMWHNKTFCTSLSGKQLLEHVMSCISPKLEIANAPKTSPKNVAWGFIWTPTNVCHLTLQKVHFLACLCKCFRAIEKQISKVEKFIHCSKQKRAFRVMSERTRSF